MLHLEYYAHSCFLIHFGSTRVLIDPYPASIGHKFPERPADYILISHDHYDHNQTASVSGRSVVVRGCTQRQLGPVQCRGVLAHHDDAKGARKGHVTCWCLKGPQSPAIVHLGDLGHLLDGEQLQEIGTAEVVMVPVGGGGCTLDARMALQVLQQLQPRLVIPMHYRTPFLNRAMFTNIDGLEPFLREIRDHFEISRASDGVVRLPELPARPTALVIPHLY